MYYIPYIDALLHSYYGKPNKAIHIGDVECYGTEDKLTECTMKSYSLKDGKNLQDNVDVAGVSCILSSSNNFTSSILRPDQSSISVSSPSVNRSFLPSVTRSSPSVTRSSLPSVQPRQTSSSQTPTLSVVSISLVCLLFILILVLWYVDRIVISNIICELFSLFHFQYWVYDVSQKRISEENETTQTTNSCSNVEHI